MAWLVGTSGADTLEGGPENDLIIGYGGADVLRGGAGDDNIDLSDWSTQRTYADGEDGNDILYAAGSGTLMGGSGDDSIELVSGNFSIDAGAGDDFVFVPTFAEATITLGAGRDVVRANSPTAVVTDFQVGDAGDRIFVSSAGLQGWDGASSPFGAGYYRLIQRGSDAVFQVDRDGQDLAGFSWTDLLRLQNVSVTQLTAWNLYGWAPDGSNSIGRNLTGSAAAEVLEGDKGDDTLAGADGNDTVTGGFGRDYITGGGGDDSLFGASGDDQLHGDDGNDIISDAWGSNFIRGGAGDDYIDVSGNGDLGSPFNDLHGNTGDDTLIGGRGGDWVVGGQGNDHLYGGGDADVVYGNLGEDTCLGADGNDWVRGGQGNDSLEGWYGDDFMAGDRGNDTISGGPGADLFHTFSGAGLDRILDFSAAEGDRVNVLAGTTYALRQEGADAIVDMGNGDQVVLVGVQLAGLPAGWIFTG